MKRIVFWIGVLLCVVFAGDAGAWRGRVVAVSDGDTLKVVGDRGLVKIRLYGVDCPEKRQEYGKQAARFTRELTEGKTVEVRPVARDRYGRTVAWVEVQGKSLNEALVESGYAWVYRRYCRSQICDRLLGLEAHARTRGRGLWRDPDPVPPWDFRHGTGKVVALSSSSRCRCDADLDCGDFSSWEAAQRCFETCFARTGRDVHRLDRDGDCVVCEGLRSR